MTEREKRARINSPPRDSLLLTDEEIRSARKSAKPDETEFEAVAKAQLAKVKRQDSKLREQIDNAMIKIAELSKKLDDREIDLIEAKREVCKAIQDSYQTISGDIVIPKDDWQNRGIVLITSRESRGDYS